MGTGVPEEVSRAPVAASAEIIEIDLRGNEEPDEDSRAPSAFSGTYTLIVLGWLVEVTGLRGGWVAAGMFFGNTSGTRPGAGLGRVPGSAAEDGSDKAHNNDAMTITRKALLPFQGPDRTSIGSIHDFSRGNNRFVTAGGDPNEGSNALRWWRLLGMNPNLIAVSLGVDRTTVTRALRLSNRPRANSDVYYLLYRDTPRDPRRYPNRCLEKRRN